jgi:nucleoid DNA-binding protein
MRAGPRNGENGAAREARRSAAPRPGAPFASKKCGRAARPREKPRIFLKISLTFAAPGPTLPSCRGRFDPVCSRSYEGESMAKKAAAKGGKAKAMTKTAMQQHLADKTGLTRKQVAEFLDALVGLIEQEIGKKGPGEFKLPGLLKVRRVEKDATAARPGKDPRTGAAITIPAKPKRTIVRVRALKALQEMVK